eukprot:479499_1
MDDDLDFSNDSLLRELQSHKKEITSRLNLCRDGLQATVDQISHIEQKREIEKLRIEKEFEKTRLNVLYILKQRKKQLLKQLDSEIDNKRELLLKRVQIYQNIIIEGADLQPEIDKLEKYELNNNQHIQSPSPPIPRKDSLTKFHFNKFINENKEKFFATTKKKPLPNMPPPPIPSNNHNDDFMAMPSPSLHNLPISTINNHSDRFGDIKNTETDNKEEYIPSKLSKKRLMLELEKYLFFKPPTANKPRVKFICNRSKFIIDLETKFSKYGHIDSSSGSLTIDLQDSINNGMNWVVNKTNPIVTFGSMIANGFKKKQEIKELKVIPPPLLIAYINPIEKALAEEFAELLTIIINQSGIIISVINNNDTNSIKKWLDPSSINATKIAMKYECNEDIEQKNDGIEYHNKALNDYKRMELNDKEKEAMHENDYAYNPDLENDLTSHCGQRSILRVCILLYNDKHNSEYINNLVEKYENKYNLKSICGVEMRKVIDKAPTNASEDCPNCYVGNIFYDENDGIVEGQDNIFQSIAKCVFSPNEFDDDEINNAIQVYDNNHYINGNNNKSHQSFQMR